MRPPIRAALDTAIQGLNALDLGDAFDPRAAAVIVSAGLQGLSVPADVGGLDATLGLAFATTGAFYPFFGTMLGWLGVALTGSDTASNVLFGSLQTISAEQTGLNPTLMAAARMTEAWIRIAILSSLTRRRAWNRPRARCWIRADLSLVTQSFA